jgi:uncharacterized membrane protein YagU involved in acid resistance
MASQWLGLTLFMAVVAGLVYVYVRHGVKIKPDPDNKPPDRNIIP